jgi:acetyl-CoA carboxylase biotin carboxyl carrier protein
VSLTAADVAEIMRLVEQSGFDSLTLEMDGIKLSLRRGGSAEGAAETGPGSALAPTLVPAQQQPPPTMQAPVPTVKAAPPVVTAAPPVTDPSLHDVPAPLLGTFYRSPKPGAPPFVEVGAQVEEETIVAIIEVMKLMNTVRAGVRGTVTEILVADGALAEYGETLLRVRKAG